MQGIKLMKKNKVMVLYSISSDGLQHLDDDFTSHRFDDDCSIAFSKPTGLVFFLFHRRHTVSTDNAPSNRWLFCEGKWLKLTAGEHTKTATQLPESKVSKSNGPFSVLQWCARRNVNSSSIRMLLSPAKQKKIERLISFICSSDSLTFLFFVAALYIVWLVWLNNRQ